MSKNVLSAVALVLALTMSAEAYAVIVVRFKSGTVLCIGSAAACKSVLSKAASTSLVQVPGYSDKLNVSVAGRQYSADSVTLSEVNGDTGQVTVSLSGRVLFSGQAKLSETVVTDATNGQKNKLSEFGQLESNCKG